MGTSGLVTILFTDLVGSTDLASSIGDGAADELRRTHFAQLRKAIETTGGTEVKTIGDAVMVSYTGAADAIAGAVAMQQAVDQHNRTVESGPRLSMRVGLSAGDATFEDEDWFGTPVVEASRLCAAAEGGQVLAADIVRVLAGSRCEHEIDAIGERELKGLPDPIAVCAVRWTPVAVEGERDLSVPLPSQVEAPQPFPFVAREEERETLVTAWKEVVAGDRRVVLVAGEPGIGKTRLVSEVARVAHDHSGAVLWGGCEDELGIPYQPFAEALRTFAGSVPPDRLAEDLGPLGGELARLVPDLPQRVPGLDAPMEGDAETERFRLFEAVNDLLGHVAATQPVMLVLDDLHWAAKPTLLMLRHLLWASDAMPLLVVGTYRDTDLDRTHPLAEMLADLRRAPGVERLALDGFDAAGVTSMLEAAAGHQLEEDGLALAEAVYGETEGNPFFVGEVLRHLAESGAIVQRDGRWTSDRSLEELGIPEGVREVIGRRLNLLPPEADEVLAIAAVLGRDFDVALLSQMVDGDQEKVLDALELAEQRGLVHAAGGRGDRYIFAHALVRTTLYDELSTSRRLRLHRDAARALADRPDADARIGELSRHFGEAAALGEVDRAIEFGRRAGDHAVDNLAYEEAIAHYERAIGALELADAPDPLVRCDLLTSLGEALENSGDARSRQSLLDAIAIAREHRDADRLARAAVALHRSGMVSEFGRDDDEKVAVMREAVEMLGDGDSAAKALLLAALSLETYFTSDPSERHRLSDEAVAIARRVGKREVLAQVLWERYANYDPQNIAGFDFAQLHDEINESIELAQGLGEPLLCRAHLNRYPLWLIQGGQVEEADADLALGADYATRTRNPNLEFRAHQLLTCQSMLAGRLDEAEERAARTLEIGARSSVSESNLAASAGAMYFRLRLLQGRLDELLETLEARVVDQPTVIVWHAALASAHEQMDRREEALEELRIVAADDFAHVPNDVLWPVTIGAAARLAGVLGDADVARAAYQLLEPYAGQFVWTGATFEVPIDLDLGTAARGFGAWEQAERHFADCLTLCERAGAPTFRADTLLAYAQMCVARGGGGDTERAHALAQDALEVAEELGLARVAVQCRRVLDG